MRSSKAQFNLGLTEARGNLNADREELAQKEEIRVELEHEYIMLQQICAYLRVRATIMTYSKVPSPAKSPIATSPRGCLGNAPCAATTADQTRITCTGAAFGRRWSAPSWWHPRNSA